MTENVKNMLALPPDFSVKSSNEELCFCLVVRSFLSTSDGSLGSGEPGESFSEEGGVRNDPPVGVGQEVCDPAIDRYDGLGSRNGVSDLNFANNQCEPLIPVPLESAGFGLSFEWSVNDATKVAEFRKPKVAAVKTPFIEMRLITAKKVPSLSLPAWSFSKSFEATLPRLVQFDEKLSADIAGHVSEPRKFGPKVRQLVDLIEGGRVLFVLAAAGQTNFSLLKSEVPKEPEGGLPLPQPSNLCFGGIDTKTKALADQHRDQLLLYTKIRLVYIHGMKQIAKSGRRALSAAHQAELRRLCKELGSRKAAEAIGVSFQTCASLAAGFACNGSMVALAEIRLGDLAQEKGK